MRAVSVGTPIPAPASRPAAIGHTAVRALYAELALYPKPGLVSPVDAGSHDDMDAATFMRSLFALRAYFAEIAAAGAANAEFAALQALGLAAERRMLCATGGVNTHRGSVFTLGLLAAAAGRLRAADRPPAGAALGDAVATRWGAAIAATAATTAAAPSHGEIAARRYGAGGAREEAVLGFPALFRVGLPALRATLAVAGCERRALVQTLFALMAEVEDTNLLYRGGVAGLRFARRAARAFLSGGGVCRPDWEAEAVAIHRAFVRRRLSPGGSADLLAASWFVHRLGGG